MRQLNAFPIRLMSVDPANLGTADAACFGTGDNGVDYCIKTVEKTPRVPAAELICYSLADLCGLSVPQYDVVEFPEGALGFGSVWDASAADQQSSNSVLLGQSKGKEIARNLSRIYAFDLFVHNVDRHLNNYLCVRGRVPGYTVKAFDFSRAFSAHGWPLPPLPMIESEATVRTFRYLKTLHQFSFSDASDLLNKIKALPASRFRSVLDSLPPKWADAKLKKRMVKWWAEECGGRIDMIAGGLKDGSFL